MFNSVLKFAKDTRENLTPLLTTSVFLEEGVLTPDEFVSAGDVLVTNSPSWQWVGASSADNAKNYFPNDKQYLVCKGCACYQRVRELDNSMKVDNMVSSKSSHRIGSGPSKTLHARESSENFDWCAPSMAPFKSSFSPSAGTSGTGAGTGGAIDCGDDDDDEFEVINTEDAAACSNFSIGTHEQQEWEQQGGENVPPSDVDEYADMEDDSLALDEATAPPTALGTAGSSGHAPGLGHANNVKSAIKVTERRARRYDCFLSYDKYYRTPRIWLYGHDEIGSPLSAMQMYQVRVTLCLHVSIPPCFFSLVDPSFH